mmetsp:Transcript_28814/g.85272  ORF Transcript_28814/g.85272 Transcript_28814/m.85272 type:complete len:220 (-) Transcript_28814:1395-2054(-)|eukprot:35139-Chlamydomonas_euryale.AAC.2
MPAWYASIFASSSGSDAAMMRTASSPALAAFPIATVATGTPLGICTIDSSASSPSRCAPAGFTGTPITGSAVIAATMPGRWAAPPAPAMMALSPRAAAVLAYSIIRSGVRCADTTVSSSGTPNSSSTAAAAFMVARSESDPMMMPTLAPPPPPLLSPPSPAAAMAACVATRLCRPPASSAPSLARASARVAPTTLMWPTLRPTAMPLLPYQCTLAPGVA